MWKPVLQVDIFVVAVVIVVTIIVPKKVHTYHENI